MLRKLIWIAVVIVAVRVLAGALAHGPAMLGIAVGWLLFVWVIIRALPRCRDDVRTVWGAVAGLVARRRARGGGGF